MTRDELIALISDVTTLLGDTLAQHVELTESLEGAGVESQKLKLDALKAKLSGEKLKLAKLKDAAKRRRELEKANQHQPSASRPTANESTQSRIRVLDGHGRAWGWIEKSSSRIRVYSASGKLLFTVMAGSV